MEKITVRMIVEILGSPKDHVEETMKKLVEKLKKEVHVKKFKIFEAQEVKKLWSSFTDVEIEVEDTTKLIDICFDYMPSSVEIIKPEKIILNGKDFGESINDMLAKLHKTDMIVKNLRAENILLKRKK